MVVIGVAFFVFGGDYGDNFSTSLTGVGVLCTMLMVCCSGWLERDGFSTIVIGFFVTVMMILDGAAGYGFSTLFGRWVMI